MKKITILPVVFGLSACTISDTYYKPDIGPNNVGTESSIVAAYKYTNAQGDTVETTKVEKYSGVCPYLFYAFKLNSDCSPDAVANKYGIKTITEVNTQWIWLPLVAVQQTSITGFPKETKK